MKTFKKITHKWQTNKNDYFAYCNVCGLRKRIKKRKHLQRNGENTLEYFTEYFLTTGEIVENSGCLNNNLKLDL